MERPRVDCGGAGLDFEKKSVAQANSPRALSSARLPGGQGPTTRTSRRSLRAVARARPRLAPSHRSIAGCGAGPRAPSSATSISRGMGLRGRGRGGDDEEPTKTGLACENQGDRSLGRAQYSRVDSRGRFASRAGPRGADDSAASLGAR